MLTTAYMLARLKEKNTYLGIALAIAGAVHFFAADPYLDGILAAAIVALGGEKVLTPEAPKE